MSSTSLTLVSAKPIDLENFDATQIGNSCRFEIDELTSRAKAMLSAVDALKTERAMKAILSGIYLHHVKTTLGHGNFGAWCTANFPAAERSVRNYMALAVRFVRSQKIALPELAGTHQLTLQLEADTDDARSAKAKLEKFVGKCGLTELLDKHQIIKRGGRQIALPSAPPAETPAANAEELDAIAFTNAFNAIEAASNIVLGEMVWTDLRVDNAKSILAKLDTLRADFNDRLLRLRHESVA